MTARKFPRYLAALKEALATGYRVDLKRGAIIGRSGKRLRLTKRKDKPYPSVTLNVQAYHRPKFSVAAHKVVAFAKFGDAAFEPGVHVRHLDGNPWNIRGSNLALGTPTQNAYDKPPEVRRRQAQLARAAQGPEAWNRKFAESQVREVKKAVRAAGHGGQAAVAREMGVHPSTISRIVNGKNYARKKKGSMHSFNEKEFTLLRLMMGMSVAYSRGQVMEEATKILGGLVEHVDFTMKMAAVSPATLKDQNDPFWDLVECGVKMGERADPKLQSYESLADLMSLVERGKGGVLDGTVARFTVYKDGSALVWHEERGIWMWSRRARGGVDLEAHKPSSLAIFQRPETPAT